MQTDGARTKQFENIVERYQRRLLSIACRMLGNMEEAKDMTQETFFRLWKSETRSSDERSLFSFLAKTVTNLCIDELRKRKRLRFFTLSTESPDFIAAPADDPEHRASKREIVRTVLRTAERLKPRQKAVFVLRDIEGFTVRETSEILGCSEDNVLVTLFNARKNMRKWLGPVLR